MNKSDFYDRLYKANPHKWEMEIYDQLAFQTLSGYFGGSRPKNLLDVGCGNGHTLRYFADRWPEVVYTGLDISNEAIQLAHKRVPGASFFCGALEDTVMPKKYDCIISLGVVEHFDDLAKSLKKIRRMLAKKGICYIEVPNCIAYPESIHEEGYRETNVGSRQEEWHLFRPTWELIIAEAGFEIVSSLEGINLQSEFVWLVR
jgi:SAM-dependent methyltransferase